MSSPRSRTRIGIRLLRFVSTVLLVSGTALGQGVVPPPPISGPVSPPVLGGTAGPVVGPGDWPPFAIESGETVRVVGGTMLNFTTSPGYQPVFAVINGKLILDGTASGSIGPIAINNTAPTNIIHADGIDVDNGGTPVLASLETVAGTATSIDTTGTNSYGLYAAAHGVAGNAMVTIDNATITTQGPGSSGLVANTSANVVATNTHIETFDNPASAGTEGSYGLGSQNQGNLTISDSTIKTHGSDAVGMVVLSQATLTGSGLTVTTDSTNAQGAYVFLNSTATLDATTINTTGAGSQGVVADGTYDAASVARTTVTGTDLNITTAGSDASGAYALGGATMSLTGGSVSTSGTGAHGLRELRRRRYGWVDCDQQHGNFDYGRQRAWRVRRERRDTSVDGRLGHDHRHELIWSIRKFSKSAGRLRINDG
jgi:hypothetical protein